MRTFVALDLPQGFEDDVAALSRQLAAVVEGRFMARETYHITLAFLGEVDERESQLAIEALQQACSELRAIELRCDGLGKFGKPNDATLWLGLQQSPQLMELAQRVRDELTARGIGFDEKAFKPHITLARRARIPRQWLPSLAFPADDVATCVTLYKSTLSSAGAEYKPLYTVELE